VSPVADKGIRVTVTDLETGESQSAEITDNYVLICAGSAYRSGVQVFPKAGTHVVTIKGVGGESRG
jgi:hypothetical protein